jgi:hypothetical protein
MTHYPANAGLSRKSRNRPKVIVIASVVAVKGADNRSRAQLCAATTRVSPTGWLLRSIGLSAFQDWMVGSSVQLGLPVKSRQRTR